MLLHDVEDTVFVVLADSSRTLSSSGVRDCCLVSASNSGVAVCSRCTQTDWIHPYTTFEVPTCFWRVIVVVLHLYFGRRSRAWCPRQGEGVTKQYLLHVPAMDGWCCCGATARETIINSINGMKNTHRNNSGGLIIVSVCP